MTVSRFRWVAVLAAPLLAACGGDARAAGPVVRDSAGVRIVENSAPAWGEDEGWRVAAGPRVDIGLADGDPEYQFGRVVGALRLADGRVAVADGQANHVRYFDAGGRHLATAGRPGGGPGEFEGLMRLLRLPGDSLAAWDWSNRLSVFDPAGEFVRPVTLRSWEGSTVPQVEGVFADGGLLVTPMFDRVFRPTREPVRDTIVLVRYAADGSHGDVLGRFPGEESVVVTFSAGGGGAFRDVVPFGRNTFRAVRDSLLYVADSERFEVSVYGPDGRLRRVVRKTHVEPAVTIPAAPGAEPRGDVVPRDDARPRRDPGGPRGKPVGERLPAHDGRPGTVDRLRPGGAHAGGGRHPRALPCVRRGRGLRARGVAGRAGRAARPRVRAGKARVGRVAAITATRPVPRPT